MRLARRAAVRFIIAVTFAAGCSQPVAASAVDATADVTVADELGADAIVAWQTNADAALETLLIRYWTPSSAYLGAVAPSNGSLTQYWTFAQAFDAVIDGVSRTGGARFAGWIETLYLGQDAKGWSRDYYDDENWMALALLRAYAIEHDAKYLQRATSLYADIEAAWDTTCCGPHPGGIWWDRAHTQKATAANAGPVITGVRLAAATGDASYLAFATRVYAYWRTSMIDPTTYAVIDHVAPGGQLTRYKLTYNEGLMIGAAVALYNATHDAKYLDDADHIAGYMLAHETVLADGEPVLFDGANAGCSGDCQQFKGIGFRYLQTLAAVEPARADYALTLASSARAIWTHARGASGLFAADWAGPSTVASSIDADSSATMALNLYAQSLGGYIPEPGARYEAEDGVVHAIGLENTQAGFDGWAYLAGWHADGQWIDFRVDVASAGHYQMRMHYAAGAGAAARLIYINGANVVAAQPFASSGSWSAWSIATAAITLPAGKSTISVIYNTSLGSKNYLNLDWIELEPHP
jgi:predicted alpha-1,6-mannanase (GH76 family)